MRLVLLLVVNEGVLKEEEEEEEGVQSVAMLMLLKKEPAVLGVKGKACCVFDGSFQKYAEEGGKEKPTFRWALPFYCTFLLRHPVLVQAVAPLGRPGFMSLLNHTRHVDIKLPPSLWDGHGGYANPAISPLHLHTPSSWMTAMRGEGREELGRV
jgi:hypothetical protein